MTAAATEPTRHVIIRTHNDSGDEVFEQFPHPENGDKAHLDLEVAKAGAALCTRKYKGHKFAAYTLVKR